MPSKYLLLTISKYALRAVIPAIIAVFMITFLKEKIILISRSVVEQRTLSMVLERRSETLSKLKNDFDAVGEVDEKIKGAMPPADNILDFVAALESMASKHSIQQSLNFNTPSDSSIDYSINLSGNVFALISYLKDFEKLPYLTGVNSVNIVSQGDWTDSSSVYLAAKLYIK